jgi:hypothetical protein
MARPHNLGNQHGPPKTDEEVFVENSTYARHHIKSRCLNKSLIPHLCVICGCPPEWRGQPMDLVLDHINGINNDNRLENLRFLCNNCDSQLPTFKARNKKSYKNKNSANMV